MKKFEEKKFNIPALQGISAKNIEEHLKLYAGYVKNANGIVEKMAELDSEKDAYMCGELFRRFSFEYNGIQNHEIYFSSLADGKKELPLDSAFRKRLEELFGSMEKFMHEFKNLALTRGVGWAMLWYEKKDDRFLASWVDEQHLGQLQGCTPILALDMWEHAYVYDYPTSEKKKYIEAFFENLNWEIIEQNFLKAL
jgi:Fe-Mn family superoxide dismutase